MMTSRQGFLFSFLGLCLIFIFQQCSPVGFKEQENASASLSSTSVDLQDLLRKVEPVMAVRASGCVTCHAKIDSGYITDFGYGSSYFLGGNPSNLNFLKGSIYGDHASSWKTARFKGSIYVPATEALGINGEVQTLAQYIEKQENLKHEEDQAPVIEKKNIYIGAPSKEVLIERFHVTDHQKIKFIANKTNSPDLSGIEYRPEGYFQNGSEMTCDGDVFLDGTLLLDSPKIKTKEGCRIYATQTIFVQGRIQYIDLSEDRRNHTNLQLVSSRAIVMGVGVSHCEGTSYPGWYDVQKQENPLAFRMTEIWTLPGHFTRSDQSDNRSPLQAGERILSEAQMIPGGPTDASCFPERREIDLERLWVNAPQIHSRYRGNFKGVIISELMIGSLGQFSFEFDPVFKSVPVVPILKNSDFLVVQ